jgi:hypothetical protein
MATVRVTAVPAAELAAIDRLLEFRLLGDMPESLRSILDELGAAARVDAARAAAPHLAPEVLGVIHPLASGASGAQAARSDAGWVANAVRLDQRATVRSHELMRDFARWREEYASAYLIARREWWRARLGHLITDGEQDVPAAVLRDARA